MSILNGKIRAAVGKALKGKLLTGTLTRQVTSDTVDADTGFASTSPATFTVEGFPADYSEFFRATAGVPHETSKIILIAANCETAPQKDDVIQFSNFGSFQVREVVTDPDKAHYNCQVYKV
jgi:hypothetical protein